MHTITMIAKQHRQPSPDRLGAVARKNGCPHTCKEVINTMYGYNAMEVQEAFNKICEQASPCPRFC